MDITCASCKKPAGLICSGCKDIPGPAYDKTCYCSIDCQKAHWHTHKRPCKGLRNRKALYRAGKILQEMFYMYRELLFDKSITKVTKEGDTIHVYEGQYPVDIKSDMEAIFPFPSDVFTNDLDKKAILTHLACFDAVAWMHEPIKHMLSSFTRFCREYYVFCRYRKLKVVSDLQGEDDNINYKHEFVSVELKSTTNCLESYALDLAGAQYGYYNAVSTFHEYADRIQTEIDSDLTGTFGEIQDKLLGDMDVIQSDHESWALAANPAYQALIRINAQTCTAMMDGILSWEEENLPVSKLLKLPANELEQKQRELIDHTRKEIQACLASMIAKATK
ncbi:set domain-containing protein 5 [Phlyctema vagabunda]|uniref:Set domain-containing protein 5 n=1 Tax=Phlyctema vagabunda TaxID=108571 RepID=A0ABR4P8K3_9HELO